ncbi:MAG: outer membrane lipoprotein-sorting protein [Candidatus Aureabacteria bacterium]|nr:outer membrane lipoprotein-sorting protein [Candidatus Auribacterota bacterium]
MNKFIFCFLLFSFLYQSPAFGEELSAREILDRIDDLWRGESSISIMSMHVKKENYERSMTMKSYSKGKDYSLIIIKKPLKEAGIATLKYEDNIYNYLPKTNKVIKIPSSMMMGSWMGSHFTNDDLVKESRLADEYDFEITRNFQQDQTDYIEITLVPKESSPSVWGKITVIVRKNDLMPVTEDYYDENMKKVRTMNFEDFQDVDGRLIPMTMKMHPVEKPDEHTIIRMEKIKFNVALPDELFSLRYLKSNL